MIGAIEAGHKTGGVATLKKLAGALTSILVLSLPEVLNQHQVRANARETVKEKRLTVG